ncbi:hypothetical protein E2C01_098577 [Portunus trituberculatus]|uniref:Uncharacterized protein n=1 Tax=Portunus trituberculatus TaxID=210409 RepID=A0A5B7KCG2_PORTR|nr:hypothetical protein [Portunus trituberculatus]
MTPRQPSTSVLPIHRTHPPFPPLHASPFAQKPHCPSRSDTSPPPAPPVPPLPPPALDDPPPKQIHGAVLSSTSDAFRGDG